MRCRICGVELGDENWYPSRKRRKDYICKACSDKRTMEKRLFTNKRSYYIIKRTKPTNCELCGCMTKKLEYHHFSEIRPGEKVAGIWLCHACHSFAERYDSGYASKYLQLKKLAIKWKKPKTSY